MRNFLTTQESPFLSLSYFDLLRDAAFHLDQATKRGNKIRRTNVHFSGPNDEDEHQNLSSDDPQVIQQEDVSSEPPEPLSYSVFQSHFQGSSTSNTQKIFLPKPIWEKLSKDQQQMIIDHNRSLPKSGSSSFSTPNKSPSPLPHKPTPQQTVKSQQVHTHQSDQSTADTTDRIPSTTPGAEPPRDARDSGSARSHSTHLETSSSDRPKWSPTRSSTRYQDQISVKCTRRTLRMPSFTRATHAQPSLSNFPRRDSNFGEQTRSRGMTLGEQNFPTSSQNKKTKLTHYSIYVPRRTISTSHAK